MIFENMSGNVPNWPNELSTELTNKLDVFARTCYRIMLGINQKKDRLTNVELYKRVGHQRPVHEIVRERQLRFTGHCLRLPAEKPANLYMLYEYKINTKPKLGWPRHTFLKQISNYLVWSAFSPPVEEIFRYAKNKSDWKLLISAPNKPVRWWWWAETLSLRIYFSKEYLFMKKRQQHWIYPKHFVLNFEIHWV